MLPSSPRTTNEKAFVPTRMPEFNEARSALTKENVQTWARNYFSMPFRALSKMHSSQWMQFDLSSFKINRSIWRSLDRSVHKHLLVIGSYAPGLMSIDDPTDCVVAHVHADEAEVSFWRIVEAKGNEERQLLSVNSTSSVAFHAPFCDVGEDTGSSRAIHRVSALILYYFLAAGHVTELQRTKSDPTMFTRNFRDACAWVENGGERPIMAPSRRSPLAMTVRTDNVAVRSKGLGTVFSTGPYAREASFAPPLNRSVTDDFELRRKRLNADVCLDRPRKHPRRTLSEQIQVPPNMCRDSSMTSPRNPLPERVKSALAERIQTLKDEKQDLQMQLEDEARNCQFAYEKLKRLEAQVGSLLDRVSQAEDNAAAAKEIATSAKNDAASAIADLATFRRNLSKKSPRGAAG